MIHLCKLYRSRHFTMDNNVEQYGVVCNKHFGDRTNRFFLKCVGPCNTCVNCCTSIWQYFCPSLSISSNSKITVILVVLSFEKKNVHITLCTESYLEAFKSNEVVWIHSQARRAKQARLPTRLPDVERQCTWWQKYLYICIYFSLVELLRECI